MALFDKPPKPTQEEELHWAHLRKESQILRMPYKRYLAILPLMEQLKVDQMARERSEQLSRRLCPTEPAPAQNIKLEAAPAAVKADEEDAMYSLPLKEQLKRKHQPSSKLESADQQPTTSKRARKDENTHPRVKPKAEPAEVVTIPEESDDEVVEAPIERQPTEQPKPQSRQDKRKQKRRQFQHQKRGNHSQSSSQQVPQPKVVKAEGGNFDYKNVDFRQFKGGAQRARGTEIKQQMRGKVSIILLYKIYI